MSEVRKVVLVPRFTTFVGAQEFRGTPILVRDYAYAELTAWRSAGVGSPTFSIGLEQSVDLVAWTSLLSIAPTAGEEETGTAQFTQPWVRFKAVLSGGDGLAVTAWMVGQFVLRDG